MNDQNTYVILRLCYNSVEPHAPVRPLSKRASTVLARDWQYFCRLRVTALSDWNGMREKKNGHKLDTFPNLAKLAFPLTTKYQSSRLCVFILDTYVAFQTGTGPTHNLLELCEILISQPQLRKTHFPFSRSSCALRHTTSLDPLDGFGIRPKQISYFKVHQCHPQKTKVPKTTPTRSLRANSSNIWCFGTT